MQVHNHPASPGSLSPNSELSGAPETLRRAGALAIGEVPAALASLVPLLERIRAEASRAGAPHRAETLRQLRSFRSQLSIFSTALSRGESILHGYSHLAGTQHSGYGPSGLETAARASSILSLDC